MGGKVRLSISGVGPRLPSPSIAVIRVFFPYSDDIAIASEAVLIPDW